MSSNDSITVAKAELRRHIRLLKSETASSREAESEAVTAIVKNLPAWRNARTILLYSSIEGELDTTSLLSTEGKDFILPVVEGNTLTLRRYNPIHLKKGYKGIMEPTEDAPTVSAKVIELALIPGVAFDRNCHRMGRGKGFYDRLLPDLSCPVIGLALSCQLVDEVPVEEHDVQLSGIAHPDGFIEMSV